MRLSIAALALLLGACAFATPRYDASPDTTVALKLVGAGGIFVGAISDPTTSSNYCRAAGTIAPPDDLTFATYIQKALTDELKEANLHSNSSPRITLTGSLDSIRFSSRRGQFDYVGYWDFAISLRSSNGKSMSAREHYSFPTGWYAYVGCARTADAFMPAVQSLIKRIVRAPDFKTLLE
jgi:hypothetical protein